MLTCTHSCSRSYDPDDRVVLISMYLGVNKICFVFSLCVCICFDVFLSVCMSVLSHSCTECEKGKYALESGSTTCRACSDDKTTQRNGMNSCVCEPGYRSFMLFSGLTTHYPLSLQVQGNELTVLHVLFCAARVCRCFYPACTVMMIAQLASLENIQKRPIKLSV